MKNFENLPISRGKKAWSAEGNEEKKLEKRQSNTAGKRGWFGRTERSPLGEGASCKSKGEEMEGGQGKKRRGGGPEKEGQVKPQTLKGKNKPFRMESCRTKGKKDHRTVKKNIAKIRRKLSNASILSKQKVVKRRRGEP